MSSKAQTVSVKKEVTAELMVDDFRVLHIQDIALPSTEFIPTHHVPQEKLSSAEADIVPQEPDSFDIGTISSNSWPYPLYGNDIPTKR